MNTRKKKKYRHKLNMLEPGTKMCKVIGITCLLGLIFRLCNFCTISYFMWGTALLIFLILLILIAIEHHQDHQLYLSAKNNDPDIK